MIETLRSGVSLHKDTINETDELKIVRWHNGRDTKLKAHGEGQALCAVIPPDSQSLLRT